MPRTPASPSNLPDLVAAGVLDASTAALAWVLLERGVPVLVAGREPSAVDALLDSLVAALPSERRPDPSGEAGGGRLVRAAGRLEPGTPPGILRAALAATSSRSGLAVAVDADDLPGVLAVLRGQGLTDEEAAFLGVVLVLGAADGAGLRLVAAHYLRPVVRDAGGHPRRLPPAVLATWNQGLGTWEDFAWGIVPDLAERCRMRAGDLEAEREQRAALLSEHAQGGHDHAGHAHGGHAHGGPVR